MTDEDWVKEATGDDAMVAELLLRFKQQQVKPTESAAPTVVVTSKRALSVEWKVRQRRSKAVVIRQSNKNLQGGHRASPTTPLSWSGGATSISGVGGGASGSFGGSGAAFDGGHEEESSRPSPSPTPSAPSKRLDTTRSKVCCFIREISFNFTHFVAPFSQYTIYGLSEFVFRTVTWRCFPGSRRRLWWNQLVVVVN